MSKLNRYTVEKTELLGDSLQVTWKDNHRSSYKFIWLRHQCECEQCGSALDGIRDNWILNIPQTLEIKKFDVGLSDLTLTWVNDGHISKYSFEWLRDHCYSDSSRKARRHVVTLWDKQIETNLPSFDFNEVQKDPKPIFNSC